jgi:hypothetical protein
LHNGTKRLTEFSATCIKPSDFQSTPRGITSNASLISSHRIQAQGFGSLNGFKPIVGGK